MTVEMEYGDIGLKCVGATLPPGKPAKYDLAWDDGIPYCEVCGRFALHLLSGEPMDTDRDRLRVASVPGVPYSAAYCEDCLRANAHPYGLLIANVAICGGLDNVHEEVVEMVKDTVAHLGKTMDEARADIEEEIVHMANMEDGS